MLGKQIFVAIGMAAAVIVLVIFWQRLGDLPLPLPDGDDKAARLAFVARWLLLPGLALFAGIAVIANQRFFVSDAIDGARVSQSRLVEITLRYNQNTLEQTVLAAIAWSGLALVLSHEISTNISAESPRYASAWSHPGCRSTAEMEPAARLFTSSRPPGPG